jgi:hypothetical protein
MQPSYKFLTFSIPLTFSVIYNYATDFKLLKEYGLYPKTESIKKIVERFK